MPDVKGSLKDIVGATMGSREGVLVFYLNEPGIQTGSVAGEVNPTAEEAVAPGNSGDFTVPLRATASMLNDNFYRLRIEWVEKGIPPMDFPNWQIRVPNGGPHNLVDLITVGGPGGGGGGGGSNAMLWWVSLTPPPNRNHIWLYLDPDNPDRETGPNPNLTLGDIVTKW